MHSFEVHSNESVCRKSGCLGLEQVIISYQWIMVYRVEIIDIGKISLTHFRQWDIPIYIVTNL